MWTCCLYSFSFMICICLCNCVEILRCLPDTRSATCVLHMDTPVSELYRFPPSPLSHSMVKLWCTAIKRMWNHLFLPFGPGNENLYSFRHIELNALWLLTLYDLYTNSATLYLLGGGCHARGLQNQHCYVHLYNKMYTKLVTYSMCIYNLHFCTITVDWEIFAVRIFHQLLRQRKLNARKILRAQLIFVAWPDGEN